MKAKWTTLVAIAMALLVAATTAMSAFAQAGPAKVDGKAEPMPLPKALEIKAPRVAPVGKDVTITVLDRMLQNPVGGAGVWAVSWDAGEELRARITELGSNPNSGNDDYTVLCDDYGQFIGWTNNQGQVTHAFPEVGRFMLVAVKDGYIPAFAPIVIWKIPHGLGIKAPSEARVHEPVTMTVYDRWDNQPVPRAGIWAFSRDNEEMIREDRARLGSNDFNGTRDYESILSRWGEFLGYTDEHGQLTHTFQSAGRYVLVTWKTGYLPGFARTVIKPDIKRLVIRAPRAAWQGDDVTMTVYEGPTPIASAVAPVPVEGAAIWAIPHDSAEILKEEIDRLGVDDPEDRDYESIVRRYGEFLGYTDEKGRLTHAFERSGEYKLAALKRGYYPGFAPITIKAKPKMLSIKAPRTAHVNEEVTMAVHERWSGEPVGAAHMWAFDWRQLTQLRDVMADVQLRAKEGPEATSLESLLPDLGGQYLGQTDRSGQIIHTFDETGSYLLITFREGYWPGFSMIKIIGPAITGQAD